MSAGDGEPFVPTELFTLGDGRGDLDPGPIADRLVQTCPEFAHLKLGEPVIMFMFRSDPKIMGQKRQLGQIALPSFGGPNGKLGVWLLAMACGGELPDFIMTLDRQFWDGAAPHQRIALVHHELKHIRHKLDAEGDEKFTEEGDPVYELVAHDLEEFGDTVRRFGAWLPDVKMFADALREGGAL
jgi:hypothetical protein